MHSVIINGKKFNVEDNAPLKESLLNAGYRFPCGGYGKCGRCRIMCPSLPVTDLDRRFLSATQLESGLRLACDKKVNTSIDISCDVEPTAADIKLSECQIAAVICDEEISVSIVGEELVETVTKPNPLSIYNSLEKLTEAYTEKPNAITNALRAAIGKESVELFEKFGAAKALCTAVAGKGLYLKILAGLSLSSDADECELQAEKSVFGLPTESIYILPCRGDFFGGELFSECIALKERSLLIDCERTVSFLHIGDNDNVAATIWDCDYSKISLRCIKSAVKLLIKDQPVPIVYLYGKYAYIVEEALENCLLTIIHRDKSAESVTNALMSMRVRSKILKEKARTSFISLYDNELFQCFLNSED